MDHFAPKKTAAQLTAHANLRTNAESFLVRGVKIQKAQHAATRAVIDRHQQLTPRADENFAVRDLAFKLHDFPFTRPGQRREAGFVLVAQRQVQRQINRAMQAEFFQRFLRRGFGRGFGGGGAGGFGLGRGF